MAESLNDVIAQLQEKQKKDKKKVVDLDTDEEELEDDGDEEDEEIEEKPVKKVEKSVKVDPKQANLNEIIRNLHDDGIYRYELLTHLQKLNENLEKLGTIIAIKDGKN